MEFNTYQKSSDCIVKAEQNNNIQNYHFNFIIFLILNLEFKLQLMYRNSFNNYSQSSMPRDSPMRKLNDSKYSGVQPSRMPLYPIGPTLTQPDFKLAAQNRGYSPYLNRQNVRPPSYQQRFLRTQMGNMNRNKMSFEDRQQQIIKQNQFEIEQQNKKSQKIKQSYDREIQLANKNLVRNLQKKQKLLAQLQSLQNTHMELQEKLKSLQPPKLDTNIYEPIDRKQHEILILKNRLISKMRQKQEQLQKQLQEEEKDWEDQLALKQKSLLALQQATQNKRMEAHKERHVIEKIDVPSIEQEIRQDKYRQFIYQADQLENRIRRLSDQRQQLLRQVNETISLKKPKFHNDNIKHTQLHRQVQRLKLMLEQMQRVSNEMELANSNLMKQLQRKQSMIQIYEVDIHNLKQKKKTFQDDFDLIVKQAATMIKDQFLQDIKDSIYRAQDEIKTEEIKNAKLKDQYRRLYDLLCSNASRSIHETFNKALTKV